MTKELTELEKAQIENTREDTLKKREEIKAIRSNQEREDRKEEHARTIDFASLYVKVSGVFFSFIGVILTALTKGFFQ